MTDAARIQALEAELARVSAENARLVAENVHLKAVIARQEARLAELERRLGQDSQNSHKPPASDGLARRPPPKRPRSAKPNGGQIGHPGHTLEAVAVPDVVVCHRPATCGQCGHDLADQPARIGERRQVFDLPPLRMQVTEHQQDAVRCPQCQAESAGAWPAGVTGCTQYGPQVQALALYLRMQHLLPIERTREVLEAVTGRPIAEASILAWEQAASEVVAPALEAVRAALGVAEVVHSDETGGRIGGVLHWLHVHSTAGLTWLGWHRHRGQAGIAAQGVLPQFLGVAVHDRWASYWTFPCMHALCHAHLQRDLQAVIETSGATWAQELKALFLAMHQATEAWRTTGQIPPAEQAAWERQFWDQLAHAERQCPRQPQKKQTLERNLLEALHTYSDEVLAFLHDLRVPFTNNQAERDLRMVTLVRKITGGWRTEGGATAFCRLRSVISCLRKQGRPILATLVAFLLGEAPSLLPTYT